MMSTSETRLTTIRTPSGLFILSLRANMGFDFETDTPAELTVLTEQDTPCEVIRTPLISQTEFLSAAQKQLLSAWEVLGSVQEPNADVQAHIATVLAHTVPELPPSMALAPLPWAHEAKPPRVAPTAAHPRAYQGTKYKPPRDKAPADVDLRPYLCHPDGLSRLLAGLPTSIITDTALSKQEMTFPEPFRVFLWQSLSLSAPSEVEHFLALYWELALDRQPQLLAAVALLLKNQPTANTRQWCRIIAQQPGEWRLTFASLLLVSAAYRIEVSTLAPSVLPLFWEVQNGVYPVYRLFSLLRSLVNGLDCEYMAAGFRLADEVQPHYPFHRTEKSGYFPEQVLTMFMARLRECHDYYLRMPLTVWERCGERPGLGRILEEIDWSCYTPDVAFQYYEIYVRCLDDDLPPNEWTAKWDWIRGKAAQIESLLQSFSTDYQPKCVTHLREFLWVWDSPQNLTRIMPSAFMLLQRLCRPPYKPLCDTSFVTSDFLAHLSPEAVKRFLHAPDTSFLRLEEACRLENNTRLIGYGTWSLTRHLPEFSVECFLNYPAKLLKVAKRLGGLPEEMREQIVRDFGRSPLMEEGLIAQDLRIANEVIQGHRQEGVFNPVPKKLQEHLAGERTLGNAQLAMYREQMNRQLSLTRLETLDRVVLSALRGHFDADPSKPNVGHALTVIHSAKQNRRALKKFLTAHWGGDEDYRMRHPLTQAWLKKHPQIDVATWLQGIVLQAESTAHGAITLSVEQEPLEALKLGTYVGSCLGLGGGLTYSAVAAVLDINKQVVYARDTKGNVLARQLLALSDQDQLICFWVYPGSVSPPIQKMFAEYDRRFAEALGIDLFTDNSDESYTVEMVLSHRWWDDMVWYFEIDGSSNSVATTQSGQGV